MKYNNVYLFVIAASIISISLCFIFSCMEKMLNREVIIRLLGVNSLYILGTHWLIMRSVDKVIYAYFPELNKTLFKFLVIMCVELLLVMCIHLFKRVRINKIKTS